MSAWEKIQVAACVMGLLVGFVVLGCESKEKKTVPEPKKETTEESHEPADAGQPADGAKEDATEESKLSRNDERLIQDVIKSDKGWTDTAVAADEAKPPKAAKPGQPAPAVVGRCAVAPKIDGKLDDACWKTAQVKGLWVDVYTGVAPKLQPKAFVCYDDVNVYIAFFNPEPKMKDLVADVDDRDGSTWEDDSNELFIDPTAGKKDYYQLIVNTKGVLYDGQGRGGGDWDSKAVVKVHKGEKAWSLEIALPLKDMGVVGSPKGQTWTANFCRNRMTAGEAEAHAWSDVGESFHTPEQFGKLKID